MGIQMNTRLIIAKHIRAHEAFIRGNISATVYNNPDYIPTGRLPSFLVDQMKARQNPLYVVFSWQTPIGWCNLDGSENWFIPDVTYSKTTNHHQSLLRVITKHPDMYT